MTAEEFLKKHQTRKKESKIAPFLSDIIKIREAGLSYNDILEFLRANNVVVSYAALSVYLRRHIPAELLPPQKEPSIKVKPKKSQEKLSPTGEKKEPISALDFFEKKRKPEVDLDFLDEE